jgi:hypothetical protein
MMDANATLHVVNGTRPGHIYLVNAVGTNKFKIGKTAGSVAHRIKDLQIGSPIRLRYVYHAYVSHMSRFEKELHYQFSCFRSIGEWFALSHTNVKECITLMRLVQIDHSLPLLPHEEEEPDEEGLEDFSVASLPINHAYTLRRKFHQPRTFFPQGSESHRGEIALKLKAQGWTKAKIILEVWGVNKGGSQKYKAAEAEYKRLVGEE